MYLHPTGVRKVREPRTQLFVSVVYFSRNVFCDRQKGTQASGRGWTMWLLPFLPTHSVTTLSVRHIVLKEMTVDNRNSGAVWS